MQKTTAYFLLILLVAIPRIALANSPFNFISDVIRSLETCKIAEERIKASELKDLVSMIKDITVFKNEILQANSMIARHRNSEKKLIREAAESFSSIYSSIVENNEQLLSFIEQTLNDPKEATAKQGTWLRKLSEIMAANDEFWRMLPYATVMATYTLVDDKRTEDGNLRFLTITNIERDQLRSQLNRAFGDQVQSGPEAGQLPIVFSAALLWKFLAEKWKPADTK